jgi:hypothetical protein
VGLGRVHGAILAQVSEPFGQSDSVETFLIPQLERGFALTTASLPTPGGSRITSKDGN